MGQPRPEPVFPVGFDEGTGNLMLLQGADPLRKMHKGG